MSDIEVSLSTKSLAVQQRQGAGLFRQTMILTSRAAKNLYRLVPL
jgi:hypothetical protein